MHTILTASHRYPESLTDAEQADFGDIFDRAIEIARREGRPCIPVLQEELGISDCRAIRIADALQRLGHAAPAVLPRRRARFQPVAA